MKFIVKAQKEDQQDNGKGRHCLLAITMCALCEENPAFCVDDLM